MQGKAWVGVSEVAALVHCRPHPFFGLASNNTTAHPPSRTPSALNPGLVLTALQARLLPHHTRTFTVDNAIIGRDSALAFFDRCCCVRPAPLHLARRPALRSRLSLIRHASLGNIFAHLLRTSSQPQHYTGGRRQPSASATPDSRTRSTGSTIAAPSHSGVVWSIRREREVHAERVRPRRPRAAGWGA
jgi:hypothetical protein